MARTIGALCTFIVALQVLIGVPLAVCAAYFCLTHGPITVEVHTSHGQPPQFVLHGATIPPPGTSYTLAPPPNAIPAAMPTSFDNPILQSRAEHGSPLTGTMLESSDPVAEQNTFVAALEKAAATEHENQLPRAVCEGKDACSFAAEANSDSHSQASRLIVGHLYEMAEIDEQAGDYNRADRWRAFARQIKQGEEPQSTRESSTASLELPISGQSPATGD